MNKKLLYPKVQVLLSTYNGSKYLEEQLTSLYSQNNIDLSVLIRDDGSCDNTKEILNKYAEKYKNFRIIEGDNVGFARSFWLLLQAASDAEYYAFCDQDDIWDNNKLYKSIVLMRSVERAALSLPVLYTANVRAVNDSMHVIKEKAFDFDGVLNLAESLERSVLPGCTFVFNKELLEIAKRYNGRLIAHDWMIYLIATIFGKVVYDPQTHMNYRIHKGNTIGISTPIKEFQNKLKRQFDRKRVKRSEIAVDLLNTYGNKIEPSKYDLIKLFSESDNPKNFRRILKYKEFRNVNFIIMVILRRV